MDFFFAWLFLFIVPVVVSVPIVCWLSLRCGMFFYKHTSHLTLARTGTFLFYLAALPALLFLIESFARGMFIGWTEDDAAEGIATVLWALTPAFAPYALVIMALLWIGGIVFVMRRSGAFQMSAPLVERPTLAVRYASFVALALLACAALLTSALYIIILLQ